MIRRALAAAALAAAALLSGAALAHPHIVVSQVVRFVVTDGVFTHVEVEWRFDPFASELEIAAADANKDGKLSEKEVRDLAAVALPELKTLGYLLWLNAGAKDYQPKGASPVFGARIAAPAVFMPEDWAPQADPPGGAMPAKPGQGAPQAAPGKPPVSTDMPPLKGATTLKDKQRQRTPRNLVYTLRFALEKPAKTVSVAAIDPEDYVRIELPKAKAWEIVGADPGATCAVDKHPTAKSEYWPGNPFFADRLTCRLP
ncbi:MAG: DUF1007 family protein [Rhodospirillales bacterium]|nr:MAG: DUF1007 family protein [Rhodospirillales bacterium]